MRWAWDIFVKSSLVVTFSQEAQKPEGGGKGCQEQEAFSFWKQLHFEAQACLFCRTW
jgi:hypothetical protein